MSTLAIAPALVPLATSLVTLATASRPRAQRLVSGIGGAALLAVAVALVVRTAGGDVPAMQLGDWPFGVGIRLRVDRVGAAFIAVSALVFVAVLSTLRRTPDDATRAPLAAPMLHALMGGVGGAFSTADFFNLYVWYEVMLVAALGLIAIGRERRHLDAALRYLVLNAIATALLLASIGAVYGGAGALDFSVVARGFESADPARATALVALLVAALLVKAGAFPLFAWLPASYPVLPPPVLALFAGLLTKVGCYAVLRIVAEVAPGPVAPLTGALGWVACATMLAGVFGAMYHHDVRRILSFHVVSQVGYILLAASLGTRAGAAAAVVYTVHHVAVKANLFLVGGLMQRIGGSHDLRRLGGLTTRPWLAVAFAVPAASLIGIPLTSGFWAKLVVVRACFEADRLAFGALALFVGGLTLYSMAKVWIEAFWKPEPAPYRGSTRIGAGAIFGTVLLGAFTLFLGLGPEALVAYAEDAAAALWATRVP